MSRARPYVAANPNAPRCAPTPTRAEIRAVRERERDELLVTRILQQHGPMSHDELMLRIHGRGGVPYAYTNDGSLNRTLDKIGATNYRAGTKFLLAAPPSKEPTMATTRKRSASAAAERQSRRVAAAKATTKTATKTTTKKKATSTAKPAAKATSADRIPASRKLDVSKALKMRDKGAKIGEIADAIGTTPGTAQFIMLRATMPDSERFKGSESQKRKAVVKARQRGESWVTIASRYDGEYAEVRKIYEEETGESVRGNRVPGKGGRLPKELAEQREPATASKRSTAKAKDEPSKPSRTRRSPRRAGDPPRAEDVGVMNIPAKAKQATADEQPAKPSRPKAKRRSARRPS